YLVYQTATQAILLLSKEVLFGLLEGKINDLPEDYVSELRRNFILVEDDCDELSIYEYLMYLGKFNVRGLNYVIVTTYNCNIECTYCYQRDIRIDSPMSIETANKVADFILSQRAEFNTKDVHLTWYGGEPLLNMKAIVIIGERLSDEGLKDD
ncbi:MAG: 4Fe-4S cluster-binding domain-containing protein, partial [Candidatus Bathyarchaeia archaeon]